MKGSDENTATLLIHYPTILHTPGLLNLSLMENLNIISTGQRSLRGREGEAARARGKREILPFCSDYADGWVLSW